MGNGGKHLSPIVKEVLNLRLHGIECLDGLTYFLWTYQLDRRGAEILSKAPGAFSELFERGRQMPTCNENHHQSRQQSQRDHDQIALECRQAPFAFGYGKLHPRTVFQLDDHGVPPLDLVLGPIVRLVRLYVGVGAAQQFT